MGRARGKAAHLVVLAVDDGLASQHRVHAGKNVLGQVECLCRLGDAALRWHAQQRRGVPRLAGQQGRGVRASLGVQACGAPAPS